MFRLFQPLHAFAVLLHTLCAIYAFYTPLAYSTPFHVRLRRMSYANLTIDMPYFSGYTELSFHVPSLVLIHGVVALVTIFFHAFVYAPIHAHHSHAVWVANRFLTVRWIEYGITCTLMTIASTLSSGIDDFNQIVVITACGILLQFLGCCIEQFKHINVYRSFFIFAVILNLGISWPIVWGNLSGETSAAVWIETIIYLFYYSLFAVNCWMDAVYRRKCFVLTDWYYNVLSVTSKVSLFWLQVGNVERNANGGVWSSVQVNLFGIALPLVILLFGYICRPSCETTPPMNKKRGFHHRLASLQFGISSSVTPDAPRRVERRRTREDIRRAR